MKKRFLPITLIAILIVSFGLLAAGCGGMGGIRRRLENENFSVSETVAIEAEGLTDGFVATRGAQTVTVLRFDNREAADTYYRIVRIIPLTQAYQTGNIVIFGTREAVDIARG